MRMLTAVLVTALLAGNASAQTETEIRLGHIGAPGSLFEASADEFARRANERLEAAGHEQRVVVFGDSRLGSDEELLERLVLGTVELALPSTVMSSVIDEFGLFEMPYLVKDREHMKRIEEEIVWPVLAPLVGERGYRMLAVWENGFRHITNNVRPIVTPEDLHGLRLRVPSGRWRGLMFQSYGADPVPMPFSAVFEALEAGEIDGQENPLAQIWSARFHEVQDHLSLTGHVYTPAYLIAGRDPYSRLPPEVRRILEETARETREFVHETAARMEQELLDQLAESGVQINQADIDAFVAGSRLIYEEFAEEVIGGEELIETATALGRES
jgi:TRAP-type transport system periplasmic protein